MRIYNKYIVILALTSCLMNSLLAFWGQSDLGIYFVTNTLAYLIITLLYVHFNPRARMALNTISMVLFGGFMVIVAVKVIDILSGK